MSAASVRALLLRSPGAGRERFVACVRMTLESFEGNFLLSFQLVPVTRAPQGERGVRLRAAARALRGCL